MKTLALRPVMTDGQYAEALQALFAALDAWRSHRGSEEGAMAARRVFRRRLDLGRRLGATLFADRLAQRLGAGELEVEAAFYYRYLALRGILTAISPAEFTRTLTPGYTAKERSLRRDLCATAGCLSCADARLRELLEGAMTAAPTRRAA